MEWLSANWLWALLGLGVVWMLFKGGCGMGGHGSHGGHGAEASRRKDLSGRSHATNGHAAEDGPREEQEEEAGAGAPRRRRRGC